MTKIVAKIIEDFDGLSLEEQIAVKESLDKILLENRRDEILYNSIQAKQDFDLGKLDSYASNSDLLEKLNFLDEDSSQ